MPGEASPVVLTYNSTQTRFDIAPETIVPKPFSSVFSTDDDDDNDTRRWNPFRASHSLQT